MKAGTQKADEIHDYYIKLEELLHETMDQETNELTEYCCATCKTTKPIDEFHKLERSITGHKYSCKSCEIKKASER